MDSASSGFEIFQILAGVLGLFIAIVWLIFPFIVMNRLRGIREEIENGNRSTLGLIQEIAKGNQFLAKIATSTEPKVAPPQPRSESAKLSIGKGGQALGRMDIAKVKTMLSSGQLTLQDHYFDAELKEWVTLESHPEFC